MGKNGLIRKFTVGSVDEPTTIDEEDDDLETDPSYGIAVSNSQFVLYSESGTAVSYDLKLNTRQGSITRCTLPIRDLEFSSDGEWIAVSSDESDVKLINTLDTDNVVIIRDHPKGVKHVSYHPSGLMVATSCADGILRFYSVSSQTPVLTKTLEGAIPKLLTSDNASAKVAWHPDGSYFAVPNIGQSVSIYSRDSWAKVSELEWPEGQMKDLKLLLKEDRTGPSNVPTMITCLAWSPNGRYFAAAATNGFVIVWDSQTSNIISAMQAQGQVLQLAWSPVGNAISFTTDGGTLHTMNSIIDVTDSTPLPYGSYLYGWNPNRGVTKPAKGTKAEVADLEEDLFVGPGGASEDEDAWIVDDDGVGYVERPKRALDDNMDSRPSKRVVTISEETSQAALQKPFQPGSSHWKNGRRYLNINMIGYVWSISEDIQHDVTVSFFDSKSHREYHFQDMIGYDLASLSAEGCLFAYSGSNEYATSMTKENGAAQPKIFFRFHTGTSDSWEYSFSQAVHGNISTIALSESMIQVCTENGYVFYFTIGGAMVRVTRQSRDLAIASAAWNDFFIVIRRNAQMANGGLVYSIENSKTFEIIQKNDSLDVSASGDSQLKSLFFSEEGDPCIFDSRGSLSILVSWRAMFQAYWTPIFDTTLIGKDISNSTDIILSNNKYWPLGLTDQHKILCIPLAPGNPEPPLPMPNPQDFELALPFATSSEHEHSFLVSSISYELLKDREADEDDIADVRLEMDTLLLRQFHSSCFNRQVEKALSLAKLIHNDNSLEAASKIALGANLAALSERINQIRSSKDDEVMSP